jgi:GNAT superfamily N-acetyltransferase
MPGPPPPWPLRLAAVSDIPALEHLIPLSVRSLQAAHYSPAQMAAALGPVFGVDQQLIADQTYFVATQEKQIIGCGGWSRRQSLFGGDHQRSVPDFPLDPTRDSARIRAFFVHPAWARRGIGRALLAQCETAIKSAGFRTAELVATLAGEPLYASCSYNVVERYTVPLTGELTLPVVRMTKRLFPDEPL